MEEKPQSQHKRQYDWLKGYQFVKGQSGNPGGMKKGTKSMKTWAREYLESLPDEERLNFIDSLPTELVWKMAEGNPHNDTDIRTPDGIKIEFANIFNKNVNTPPETGENNSINSEVQSN